MHRTTPGAPGTHRGRRRLLTAVAAVATLAIVAVGCSSDDADDAASNGDGGSSDAPITIGYIPWDEDIAVTYLWKSVLEEKGYEVEATQLDVAPTFTGVAEGDLDLFFDTWLPVTHADYWEEYGDQVEDLGVWYDNAKLTIAVPEYMDIDSIGDLAGMEDELDGKIIGIEPGAGLTRVTRDEAMPTYGLDGFELVTSSTTAMLSELTSAIDDERPVVVTLWRPHWAYSEFPIKDLEDPEGAMGDIEEIKVIARKGFTEAYPEVAEAIEAFTMDDEKLGSLEAAIQETPEDPEAATKLWIADNQEWVDGLMS